MANSHTDDGAEKDAPTSTETGKDDPTQDRSVGGTGRRTFMKGIGAAVGIGSLATAASVGRAAGFTTSPSGAVTVDPGEYSWDGSGLDIGSGDALIGGGNRGDVVVNLEGGTMDGSIAGTLENIVVRGSNPNSKSGLDLEPGALLDGFVWPDGGQQSEDRALYTPDGGDDRLTIRNSMWAWMVNNGAYVDKPPVTMENCASINNNIAGIRVGHRDGTSSGQTTYIRNSIVAVTADILNDDTNSPNARGIRLRQPADLVIENCWFVYLDVDGGADLIELHDGAAGSNVTIRDCAFYNDSGGDLVRDKSDGQIDVTIENCVVAGSGSRTIEPDYSGSGVSEVTDLTVPLPSSVTGYAVADDVEGVGAGITPWADDGSTVATATETETETAPTEHTLVLHASPDNSGPVDVSFTVAGSVAFAPEAESDTDTIVTNDDGTVTATSVGLDPDALDSYRFDGEVVDYSVPSGAVVDVSVDGTATTFEDLLSSDSTDTETDTTTETETDTTTDTETDTTTDTETDTTTETETDTTTDTETDTSGDSGTVLPHRVSMVGADADEPTAYTFTVSGDVARDGSVSVQSTDGSPWDRMEDIAKDGKVIGLVGSGTDAYRFDGNITDITVDGDATLSIERNV